MTTDSGFWWDGPTADGVEVRIPQDPYKPFSRDHDPAVFVGGERVEITGTISRLRDGGTTTIPTSAGVVRINRRIGTEHSVSIRSTDG